MNTFLQKSNPNLQPLGQKSEEKAVKTDGTRKGHLSGLKKAKKTFEDKITAKKKAEEDFRRKQEEKEAAVKKYKEKKVTIFF